MDHRPIHLVLMGVSGCGKTSVASTLERHLSWPYAEADDFHPQANKDKMALGVALNDEDRWPWLETLRSWMSNHAKAGNNTIVTCSALKQSYRDLLAQADGDVVFVHLSGSQNLIAQRMSSRVGHFMPATLLPSQFATLEPLAPAEDGFTVDIARPIADIVDTVLAELAARKDSQK
ncbi:gluconokinase [Corynebacterium sp. H128]|uniref:gluconokinase n=1 Tax=unclassified Corynebacterium TaxID=2624378 RepID=UPI0030B071E5